MIDMRALIDRRNYFNHAAAYYRMFSWDVSYYGENILEPRKVTRVNFNSIAGLLNALRRFGREGENRFLIVSHGNPDGLPIRIVANNRATLNSDIMNNLSRALDDNAEGRRNAMSYIDNRGNSVFRNERQLDELLSLIRDVRQLQIEHIEFRGCNIGAGPALRAVHRLLGARLTAAPRVRFVWGRLRTAGVHGTPDWLRNQISQLSPVRRLFTWIDCLRSPEGSIPDTDVVFALAVTDQGNNPRFQLLASNTDVVQGWTQSYLQPLINFAAGRVPPGGGYRPIISFSTPNNAQYPFVFPGDAFRYTEQIAYEIGPARWIPQIP